MNIAIIGLGLIGGSYAKATKSRTLHTVYGYDLDQEVMMFARMTGAMDKALTDELLRECDLVITALRPAAAICRFQQFLRSFQPSNIRTLSGKIMLK